MRKDSTSSAQILTLFLPPESFPDVDLSTFSSILRVLLIHYDMEKSLYNLTSQGTEDSINTDKKEHVVITCDVKHILLPITTSASVRNRGCLFFCKWLRNHVVEHQLPLKKNITLLNGK